MINCQFEDGGKVKLRHVVVHALVERDNKLLLVKRTGDLLETGKWSLPSGYLNRDETVGEGMLRELKEETGVSGEIVSLFRVNSNPNRQRDGGRQNVAIEFIIHPKSEIGEGDGENSKIEWISIDSLIPFDDFAFDHGETIKLYLKYHKEKFQLPLLI